MNPDWNNTNDRKTYYELLRKNESELTKEEKTFLIDMYHQEQFYDGEL